MFKATVFVAALTALAAPALAGSGLERSLGLTPGVYSEAQVARLATLGDDQITRRAILDNPQGPQAFQVSMSSKGTATEDEAGPKVWISIKSVKR